MPHFWSLKGVSLSIKAGETLGIIGINGSGKSTLSNIISGIIPQTTGSGLEGILRLLQLEQDLKRNLTGSRKHPAKGSNARLSIQEIEDLKSSIIDFADIGNFIDQPVKDYSTGMRSRLGFAIAVHINPDIIMVMKLYPLVMTLLSKMC